LTLLASPQILKPPQERDLGSEASPGPAHRRVPMAGVPDPRASPIAIMSRRRRSVKNSRLHLPKI
jgi:hypothetical protein